MLNELGITRLEYIDILRNRGKQVSSEISDNSLLRKVKYLKKRDLIHLATIRGLVLNETNVKNILDPLFKYIYIKLNFTETYQKEKMTK